MKHGRQLSRLIILDVIYAGYKSFWPDGVQSIFLEMFWHTFLLSSKNLVPQKGSFAGCTMAQNFKNGQAFSKCSVQILVVTDP